MHILSTEKIKLSSTVAVYLLPSRNISERVSDNWLSDNCHSERIGITVVFLIEQKKPLTGN